MFTAGSEWTALTQLKLLAFNGENQYERAELFRSDPQSGALTHTVNTDCQHANFISNVAPCWLWK